MQQLGCQAHFLQPARHEVLDEHLRMANQLLQVLQPLLRLQVQHHGALVAPVNFPVNVMAFFAPVAKVVARDSTLDLDHVGTEIGQVDRQHVAGDEPRQIEDADVFEGAADVGLEFFHQMLPTSVKPE